MEIVGSGIAIATSGRMRWPNQARVEVVPPDGKGAHVLHPGVVGPSSERRGLICHGSNGRWPKHCDISATSGGHK